MANAQDVAAVVKQDPGISARVLQLVNSAFFRLSREIGSVEQAVVYLGFDALQRIVLAAELFSIGKGRSEKATLALRELQKHSLAVANVAVALTSGGEEETYFTAALLHDVGKLLMTLHLPDHLDPIHEKMRSSGEPMHEVETQLFGVTHAEIGGYLLGVWGLPYGIVEAVANHHAPSRVGFAEPGLVSAVHLADALVHTIVADQSIVPDPKTIALYGPQEIWSDWLEQFRDLVLTTSRGLTELT